MAAISSHQVMIEDIDGVRVVSFKGSRVSIHGELLDEIAGPLLDLTLESSPQILIDLESVEFFNSTFIELLIRIWNRLKNKPEGRFAMCNVHAYCLDILEVTNMTSVINIDPDRPAALANFHQTHLQD